MLEYTVIQLTYEVLSRVSKYTHTQNLNSKILDSKRLDLNYTRGQKIVCKPYYRRWNRIEKVWY